MWTGSLSERQSKMMNIIHSLERLFPIQSRHSITDPFPLLIATILSQNTSDKNSSQAFQNLQSKYEIKPHILAQLQPDELEPYIKVAGLHEIRSKRIIEISKTIITRFKGNMAKVLQLSTEKARTELMSLKGVGPKTADILLNFISNRPVMPVDTNIFRVSERIGLVKGRNYEKTRSILEELIPKEKLREMHFSLIRFGREICKPQRPQCPICPIINLCDYSLKTL